MDADATAAIGIGLGISPYVSLGVALGLVVVYLAMSINVYLESTVFGAFRLAYGRLGPTEVRLMLIAVNAGLALHRHVPGLAGVPIRLVTDGLCVAACGPWSRSTGASVGRSSQRCRAICSAMGT